MTDHPCEVCESKAVDRAIICPALGVIDANRCKRIKKRNAGDAFEMLYGLRQGSHNARESIKIKRDIHTEHYRAFKVFKGGLSLLTLRKPRRRPTRAVGLTSDSLVIGAGELAKKGAKKALRGRLTENSGLAAGLQAQEYGNA